MGDTTAGAGRVGESRWPMALAVLTAAGLSLLLPPKFRFWDGMHLAYPAVLVVLLAVLIIGDPGRIDRENRWLRVAATALIGVITAITGLAAVRLVAGIVNGHRFGGPTELLSAGAVVWVTSVIAFALWYWHLDCGGPAARAHGDYEVLPAFRFPEQSLDEPKYAAWYPQFIDYLALSFYTGTAFGPTDVSAVRHWSKMWLITQAGLSLAIIGLVIARAVNIL